MDVITAENKSPSVKTMVSKTRLLELQFWFYAYMLSCMLLGQFLDLYQFLHWKLGIAVVPTSVLLRGFNDPLISEGLRTVPSHWKR